MKKKMKKKMKKIKIIIKMKNIIIYLMKKKL